MEILTPTSNRAEVVGLSLLSLAFQNELPNKITILDNGEIPIFSSYVNRMVVDILAEKGIETILLRSNEKYGIVKARRILLERVIEDFMFLDDDAILEPNYIEEAKAILRFYECSFAGGLFLMPNNEMNKPDFSTIKLSDLPEDVLQYQQAFFRYNKTIHSSISYGGISGVLFKHSVKEQLLKSLENIPDNTPLEDFILTKAAGGGILVTNAVAWHLFNPEQKRDWRYALENILRKKFENNPEQVKKLLEQKGR